MLVAQPADRFQLGGVAVLARARRPAAATAWSLPRARVGGVQRAGHHALGHRPAGGVDPVVDHVGKDVRVEHVALAEEQEGGVERPGPVVGRLQHDLAQDPLPAVGPGHDGRGQRLVGDGAQVVAGQGAGRPSGGRRRAGPSSRAHPRRPARWRRSASSGPAPRRPSSSRRASAASTDRRTSSGLPVVGVGVEEGEVDAAQPHHGPEVLLQPGLAGVVAARLELRKVDDPVLAAPNRSSAWLPVAAHGQAGAACRTSPAGARHRRPGRSPAAATAARVRNRSASCRVVGGQAWRRGQPLAHRRQQPGELGTSASSSRALRMAS